VIWAPIDNLSASMHVAPSARREGSKVDMAQAEAFLAVAEELHFGRAAQRLRLSQPRVSRLVAALERQIGSPLFERTSRRVALTPLGAQFRDELGTAYAGMQAALDHARTAARAPAGQLRIGFTATSNREALTGLISAFENKHPECQVRTEEVEIFDPYAALRRGEIDVLVNWLPAGEPDLSDGPVIDQVHRVLAVARDHPLAGRRKVCLDDLAGCEVALLPPSYPPALYDMVIPPRTPSGRPIRRTQPVRAIHEILSLVARGKIVHPTGQLPLMRRDDITLVPLAGLPPVALGLIWRTAQENARIRALAAAARSTRGADRDRR
jgi:DNA-binding transcriptional LysR family regulator